MSAPDNMIKFVPVETMSDAALVAALRAHNARVYTAPQPAQVPDRPGWWLDLNTRQWYKAKLMHVTKPDGWHGFELMLLRPWPSDWVPAQETRGWHWEGPHTRRDPWRLELVREDGLLYLPVPDEMGHPKSLLCSRSDGGDPFTAREKGADLDRCLYDEANTNEFVQTDDTVWLDGEEIGHFDLPHYVPNEAKAE